MKNKLVLVSIATLVASVVVTTVFLGIASLPASAQKSIANQVKVEITGMFKVEDADYIRFIDAETKVVCYMQGALKNQVQHLDRVWCCDGKTLRTIEA